MPKISKRAQLSIFITIGVLILILIGIIFYLRTSTAGAEKATATRETLQFPTELKPVGVFVQACLEQEAEKTINVTALQAGRPLAPRHPYSWNNMTLSHGYYMGLNDLPALDEMQTEMDAYLQIHLDDCLNGLKSFRDRGMDLQAGQSEPSFKVGTDAVVVDLKYPITLQGQTGTQTIEKFSAVIPSRLGYLHDAAYKVVQEDVKNSVNLYYLTTFEVWGYVTTIDPESRRMFISLEDRKNQSLRFNFVNTYTNESSPTIQVPSNFRVNAGDTVTFYVNATDEDGDNLTFSDDTSLFDIGPRTGYVSFVADTLGYYNIMITADDGKGGIAQDSFAIYVSNYERQ